MPSTPTTKTCPATADKFTDAMGFIAPVPAKDGHRQMAPEDFSFGPQVGEKLPDFTLPSSLGGRLTFHEDRAGHKAALVFVRSAVW